MRMAVLNDFHLYYNLVIGVGYYCYFYLCVFDNFMDVDKVSHFYCGV